MTRVLDERFLSPHPRTARWWKEREMCGRCEHVRYGAATTCAAVRGQTCITARDPGQLCGPAGRLFVPKGEIHTVAAPVRRVGVRCPCGWGGRRLPSSRAECPACFGRVERV